MNGTTAFKSIGALIGTAVVFIFPTEILQKMLLWLAVVAVVDTITGLQAAIAKKVAVTPQAFMDKAGRKLTRGVAYLSLAWVVGQMIGSALPKPGMISEPIGGVLGLLIGGDMLSVIRNLATAKNNLPILDRYFTAIAENLRNQDRRQVPDRRQPEHRVQIDEAP